MKVLSGRGSQVVRFSIIVQATTIERLNLFIIFYSVMHQVNDFHIVR